jgi:hypothetical protein
MRLQDYSSFFLQWEPGRGAAEGNRIARGFGATAPPTRNAGSTASIRRRFGDVAWLTRGGSLPLMP